MLVLSAETFVLPEMLGAENYIHAILISDCFPYPFLGSAHVHHKRSRKDKGKGVSYIFL